MNRGASGHVGPHAIRCRRTPVLTLGSGAMLMAALLLPPLAGGVSAAEWIITPSITVKQSFTDNARHESRGQEDADTYTSVIPAISITANGDRLNLHLNYAVTGSHYYNESDLDGLQHSLLGGGTAELVQELLYLDARAAIFQQVINPTGAQSAGQVPVAGEPVTAQNDDNTTTAKTYSLSPYLRNRFGNFADSELRYRFNQSISGTGDTLTHTISETLTSGSDFTRLRWVAQAIATDTEGSRGDASDSTIAVVGAPHDSSRQLATFSPEYVLNRNLSLLGSIGYERIDDDTLREEPNGIIGNAGVRVNPGPRSTFRILWNHRFDENYFTGDASYLIGPTTRIDFAYTRDIYTGQSLYAENLSYLGTDEFGNFIDTRTLQMFRLDNEGLGFSNTAFKQERYSLRLTTELYRDSFSAELFRQVRESQNVLSTQTTNGVNFGWSRPLTPVLGFRFGLTYTDTEFDAITENGDTREDHTVRGGPGLTYSFNEKLVGTLNYDFIYRFSNVANSDQRENIITVGIRKIF